MRILTYFGLVAFLAITVPAHADDDWVATSDAHAQAVLEVMSKFSPEGAGRLGVDGLDEEIAELMQELREAMQDYMRQLAEQQQGDQPVLAIVLLQRW